MVILYALVQCLDTKELCPLNLTMNLKDGFVTDDAIVKNNMTYFKNNYFITANGQIRGCICNLRMCIRKCCPNGYSYTKKSCVADKNLPHIEIKLHKERVFTGRWKNITDYHIIHDNHCKWGKYKLIPDYEGDLFFFQDDGRLHLPNVDHKKYVGPEDYCIDNERINLTNVETSVFLCVFDEVQKAEFGSGKKLALGNKIHNLKI